MGNGKSNEIRAYWEKSSCGEADYLSAKSKEGYREQAEIRYRLEPYILEFIKFNRFEGKSVLEIGVGLGADHQIMAESGMKLYGIDLTERAVRLTRHRLKLSNLRSFLSVADARKLPFHSDSFDAVYAWGSLHHTSDVEGSLMEINRVLKANGELRIMIYHKYSIVGLMLWIRYGLFELKPWADLNSIYAKHLESPGTQAYSIEEAKELFRKFRDVKYEIVLTHGDLLTSRAGKRHFGFAEKIIKFLWPRWLIERLFKKNGLYVLVRGRK